MGPMDRLSEVRVRILRDTAGNLIYTLHGIDWSHCTNLLVGGVLSEERERELNATLAAAFASQNADNKDYDK